VVTPFHVVSKLDNYDIKAESNIAKFDVSCCLRFVQNPWFKKGLGNSFWLDLNG